MPAQTGQASGRRPNTNAPSNFITVSSEQLMVLDDKTLLQFADEVLGIRIAPGTKRTTILTRIVNAAVMAKDGL
jgi:hypothetical protein